MGGLLTRPARTVIALADQEARRLNHEYIGMEHILLGLNRVDLLLSFGVGPGEVMQQIEKLVQLGCPTMSAGQLPFTPRAKRVIELAIEEAHLIGHDSAGPEHLLLGLLRDTDGVAACILQHVGLNVEDVRAEVLKIGLLKLKVVERAVRPVRATTACKRKIRQELLAHLTGIYEAEQVRLSDPAAAVAEAARRFGDPAELARELENALPTGERRRYYVEHWLGWRAPESAARYLSRLAAQLLLVLAAIWCALTAALAVFVGWDESVWTALRPGIALVLFLPAAELTLGLLYFQMRDSLFGALGSRKSRLRVFVLMVLIALTVLGSGLAFIAVAAWDLSRALPMFWPCSAAAIVAAGGYFVLARQRGPTEIRDTLWACLELDGPLRESKNKVPDAFSPVCVRWSLPPQVSEPLRIRPPFGHGDQFAAQPDSTDSGGFAWAPDRVACHERPTRFGPGPKAPPQSRM